MPLTLSRAFTVGHICIIKNTGAFTRGGSYSCLLLPDTYFHFHLYNRVTLLDVVPLYVPANQTLNVVLIITMHSHPFNAMSPCICNVMRHCMLYYATCIMNVTWTMLKPYTSPCTMDNYINQHKISKRSHISCQYICTHIYQQQQVITNQTMTYFIL